MEERRKYPRASFFCKIFITSPVRMLTSHTDNISVGGIKVILEEKLAIFTTIGLEIFFDREKPIRCKGKVVWVREKINPLERKPLLYETGIEFTEIADVDREYIKKIVDAILEEEEK